MKEINQLMGRKRQRSGDIRKVALEVLKEGSSVDFKGTKLGKDEIKKMKEELSKQ